MSFIGVLTSVPTLPVLLSGAQSTAPQVGVVELPELAQKELVSPDTNQGRGGSVKL